MERVCLGEGQERTRKLSLRRCVQCFRVLFHCMFCHTLFDLIACVYGVRRSQYATSEKGMCMRLFFGEIMNDNSNHHHSVTKNVLSDTSHLTPNRHGYTKKQLKKILSAKKHLYNLIMNIANCPRHRYRTYQ